VRESGDGQREVSRLDDIGAEVRGMDINLLKEKVGSKKIEIWE
jgi:hypothetical protein